MNRNQSTARDGESGFSLIELLVVMAILLIIGFALTFYLTAHQTLYRPDDQTLLIADILQEARQRSLTQVEPMRVQVNADRNSVSLWDENSTATVDDDVLLRQITMFLPSEVTVGTRPSNVDSVPPELLPAPEAVFVPSVYPASVSERVCTMRFMPNGTVVNQGTSATGTGAVVTGTSLFVWAPNRQNANNSDIARALTVIGATGTIRAWEYDHDAPAAERWRDSRRSGSY